MKKIGYAPPLGCVLDVDARYHDAPQSGYFMEKSLHGFRCQMIGGSHWTQQGYKFDGTAKRIEITHDPIMTPANELSLGISVHPEESGRNQYFAGYRHSAAPYTQWVIYQLSNDSIGSSLIESDMTSHSYYAAPNPGLNDWHRIWGVYDTVNAFIFVDGVRQADVDTFTNTLWQPTLAFRIGTSGTEYLNGLVDKIRLFNRGLTHPELVGDFVQSRRLLAT